MNDAATIDSHGVLVEPTTLVIQRHLPGPIERVWDYLAPPMAGRRRHADAGRRHDRAGLAQ
jgi:uncharacterized protein YndB with AHSA1/START domain